MQNFTSESYQLDIHASDHNIFFIQYIRLVILIVGVLGNTFSLFVLNYSCSIRKSRIYALLINQCILNLVCTLYLVCHITYTIIYITKIRIMTSNWDWMLCTFIRSEALSGIAACGSSYNLAASSFERCTSVLFPIAHRNIFTRKNIKRLCFSIWMLGFIIVIPHSILLNGISKIGFCNSWMVSSKRMAPLLLSSFYLFYFISPLFIIIVSFIALYKRIIIRKLKAKLNIIQMLFSCAVLYLMLQGQRIFISFVSIYYTIHELNLIISLSVLLLSIGFSINPIVYAIQYTEYKYEIRRQFYRLRGRRVANLSIDSNNSKNVNLSTTNSLQ